MAKRKVLVNFKNWKRLLLTTLCIGSKIWDDDSLENEHFPRVIKVTLWEVSKLEKSYLSLIEYDVLIWGKDYAKAFFTF